MAEQELTIEQLIDLIMAYIFMEYGELANLVVGIWDASADTAHTYYAELQYAGSGETIAGESSYGSDTYRDAIESLWGEL